MLQSSIPTMDAASIFAASDAGRARSGSGMVTAPNCHSEIAPVGFSPADTLRLKVSLGPHFCPAALAKLRVAGPSHMVAPNAGLPRLGLVDHQLVQYSSGYTGLSDLASSFGAAGQRSRAANPISP